MSIGNIGSGSLGSKHWDVPVLIVGAGPSGLASSLALRRYGVEHILIERHEGTAHTPRAHIVNQHTVEILRHLGVEERFNAVATPQEYMRNIMWTSTIAGREIMRVEGWGTSDHVSGAFRASSPCPIANCAQTVFEPMLVEAIKDAGGEVHFRHELESLEQDSEGVTSKVRNLDTGELITARSKYVIGADGARGRVLGLAGLTLEGPSGLADVVNIWYDADLTKYFERRLGVLTWTLVPGNDYHTQLSITVCYKPFTNFILMMKFDPERENPADWTDEDAIKRVRATIGADVEVAVKSISRWQVNAQVAPVYSAGRLFCMGDAVHRHPPTNGLGLNMSVADAFNLAWKMALVLDGRAGPGLLDSYTTERQPVGAAGVHRAITSLGEPEGVDAALGLVPGQTEEEVWAAIAGLDEPGPLGAERRRVLREVLESTDFHYNAHGVHLGYHYTSAAVVSDGTPAPEPTPDADIHYRPSSRPGARLPHARLERDGKPISSLDLVDGLGFALLTGPNGQAWVQAAADVAAQTGVPISVHVIGGYGDGLPDPYRDWSARSEVDTNGAVLVRPDRHVAWRYSAYDAAGPQALHAAVAQVLALDRSAT